MDLVDLELIKYYLDHVNKTVIDDLDKLEKITKKVELIIEQATCSNDYQEKMKQINDEMIKLNETIKKEN